MCRVLFHRYQCQQNVSSMHRSVSAHSDGVAYRASHLSPNGTKCLRDPHDGTGVFANPDVLRRDVVSPPQAGQNRQISFLGEIIAPFAGVCSEDIACKLLARFGSFDRILQASDSQLNDVCQQHPDVGAMIAVARNLVRASWSELITRSPVDANDPTLHRYLSDKFHGQQHEELQAIFVDAVGGFIAEEVLAKGREQSVQASIALIAKRTFELDAKGIILFHNHPACQPAPSAEDILSTRRLSGVLSAIGVRLIDHLIVAGRSVVSMKGQNLL